MKKTCCTVLALAGILYGVGCGTPAPGLAEEYHGADSVFQAQGVAVLWAILKGVDEAHSTVVIRIESLSPGRPRFGTYSVSATHPFSGARQWVVSHAAFGTRNTVKSSRAAFGELPGRRILFYSGSAADRQPAMDIYYMSIPDTAPEFLDASQLETYLDGAVERLKAIPK